LHFGKSFSRIGKGTREDGNGNLEKLKKLAKSHESETKIQVKLIEQNPDGYDGSDGFSKALILPNGHCTIQVINL
jgi:hypothetical protein